MTQVELDDVLRYVHHVALHPFEDVTEIAKMYFDDKAPLLVSKEVVVQDLMNISRTKRALIVNILRDKTNFDINIMSENDAKQIKKAGETFDTIMKKEISVIKPTENDEDESTNTNSEISE